MTNGDVFCMRESEWQIRIAGHVLPHIWNSRGAALAGLKTEARRFERRRKINRTADLAGATDPAPGPAE